MLTIVLTVVATLLVGLILGAVVAFAFVEKYMQTRKDITIEGLREEVKALDKAARAEKAFAEEALKEYDRLEAIVVERDDNWKRIIRIIMKAEVTELADITPQARRAVVGNDPALFFAQKHLVNRLQRTAKIAEEDGPPARDYSDVNE